MIRRILAAGVMLGVCLSPALAQKNRPVHRAFGQKFWTWSDYVTSPHFRRCGCAPRDPLKQFKGVPTDCDYQFTNPSPDYDPTFVIDIPVVVHVIQSNSGQGYISPAMVQSQIDILNEDFLAIAGTNGGPGTDTRIRFHLATEDPAGQPTTGITYSTNNSWFNDGGAYWDSLAWDPHRFLNIYTNRASGALGYVPDLPQGGLVGEKRDRVVVLWSAFGRNAPIGAPFDQGRTATHEVGHYLGLFHTFDGGCGGGNCYSSGDTICDTAPEAQPASGCPTGATSCGGSPAPVHNYMDYSDDVCMSEFTPEQTGRMRCTLLHWRPLLGTHSGGGVGTNYCGPANTNSSGFPARIRAEGSDTVSDDDLELVAFQLPPNKFGYFIASMSKGSTQPPGSQGQLCLGGQIVRYAQAIGNSAGAGEIRMTVDLTSVPPPHGGAVQAGETWHYQLWFRDRNPGPTSNFTDGVEIVFQ